MSERILVSWSNNASLFKKLTQSLLRTYEMNENLEILRKNITSLASKNYAHLTSFKLQVYLCTNCVLHTIDYRKTMKFVVRTLHLAILM